MAFRAVADNRGWLTVAWPVLELLERRVYAIVMRGVYAMGLPSERLEHRFEAWHRKNHAAREIELAVVLIDQQTEIIELLRSRIHHRFPNRAFLQLAVSGHGVGVEARAGAARDREALRNRE